VRPAGIVATSPFDWRIGAALADRLRLKLGSGRRQLTRAAVFVDGHKGELGVGNFDPGALALAQHSDLDIECDRGSPEPLDSGVAAGGVTDMHRVQKGDVRHRYGYHPSTGMRGRRHFCRPNPSTT
jgi:hypothetical protein